MSDPTPPAFSSTCIDVPIADIIPLRKLAPQVRKSIKYRQIASSLAEVGLIEPLVVYPNGNEQHLLLDGHLRLDLLLQLGVRTVRCVIATDDEAYTYNKRVNRLAPIQEHYMILKALQHGVAETRLAKTLNVDVGTIRKKRDLLDGICDEAADLLKDQSVTIATFQMLRKMKPVRQVASAELMIAARNYSVRYAKLLLAGTPGNLLLDPDKPRAANGLSQDQQRNIEQEMDAVLRDLKGVEASYGEDVVTLTVSSRYLAHLLANARVQRYLKKHYAELLAELQSLQSALRAEKTSLPAGPASSLRTRRTLDRAASFTETRRADVQTLPAARLPRRSTGEPKQRTVSASDLTK